MMSRKIAGALAVMAVLGTSGAAVARDRLSPEQRLEKRIGDRVAGEPVDCIYLPTVRSSTIYDKTAIVYESGSTLYVNRPENGASSLDDSDILVTRPHGSQLCSIDTVQLRDRSSHFYTGSVFLGKFVPYRKVAARD